MWTLSILLAVFLTTTCRSLPTPGNQWRPQGSDVNAAHKQPFNHGSNPWLSSIEKEKPAESELPANPPEVAQPKPQTPSKKDPCRPTKSSTNPQPPVEDQDEYEYEENPRKGSKPPGRSVYRNFFPMMFGSLGGGRSAGDESGRIAIANSFSTGRGAMAMSTAEAFGGSDPNQFRKSVQNRYRV